MKKTVLHGYMKIQYKNSMINLIQVFDKHFGSIVILER
jgi:hypothetical protein